MSPPNLLKFSPLLENVRRILEDETGIYLVGGAVRDALLNKSSHDLDFVVEKDALRTARRVADGLGGSYYTMEEDFQIGRVILDQPDGPSAVLDFAAMQGQSLPEDLQARDFTLNAMAVDLHQPAKLIDPLGGAADLLAKRLQVCSPTAIIDDPVRALRAVRMSAVFKLAMTPAARQQIAPAVRLLDAVSSERLRDEFFKILDAPKPAASLRVLDHFGMLDYMLPELAGTKGVAQSPPHIYDVWEHSLQTVQKLTDVLSVLDAGYSHDNEMGGDVFTGLLSLHLGRYRLQVTEHLLATLSSGRTQRSLLYLAALCHDFTKPQHKTVEDSGRIRFTGHESSGAEAIRIRAEALPLSRAETKLLFTIVQNHHKPLQFTWHDKPVTKQAVYRFWRDTEEAGVDVCLVSVADALAIYGHTMPKDTYQKHLEVIRALLEAYWENPEDVVPQHILNGNDIMDHFSLEPGPQIGDLLEALREAQAVGEVKTEQEAYSFIAGRLAGL